MSDRIVGTNEADQIANVDSRGFGSTDAVKRMPLSFYAMAEDFVEEDTVGVVGESPARCRCPPGRYTPRFHVMDHLVDGFKHGGEFCNRPCVYE
jgi:hypothetical protein